MGSCVNLSSCGGEEQRPPRAPSFPTIGEVCDQRIQSARKQVEALCIQKAKLEAMNLLNHPYMEMRDLINGDPF